MARWLPTEKVLSSVGTQFANVPKWQMADTIIQEKPSNELEMLMLGTELLKHQMAALSFEVAN